MSLQNFLQSLSRHYGQWFFLDTVQTRPSFLAMDNQTAIPGHGWRMLWVDKFDEFQLDIVGFLAILGEGSILSTAQISALSCLFYLPRLIPAPQALLRTARPSALPTEMATITAVHSGNIKEHIPQVAHVLL